MPSLADTPDSLVLEPFSPENVEAVHAFFEANAGLYSFPIATFKQASILDDDFDPDVSIVARARASGDIVGAFLAIIRRAKVTVRGKEFTYTFTTLNMFCVHPGHRRQGIGSALLGELLSRLRRKKRRKVRLMASAPNYLFPGLDPRYTAAVFFLKKNGFTRGKGEKQNLLYTIPATMMEPPSSIAGFTIRRAIATDEPGVTAYIKKAHPGFWASEVQLAFRRDPVPTFIAVDGDGVVVGFASHSIQFPGSFGPTGVSKEVRGKGVGGVLLRWCAWDLKAGGSTKMIIMWVEGETMKFYSKAIGARVHHVYWTFQRRI